MIIRFGSNEYDLVPGSAAQTYDGNLHLDVVADGVDFEELEEVLQNSDNLDPIKILDNGEVVQVITGYGRLYGISKEYNVLYWIERIEPEPVDPEDPEAEPGEPQDIEHRVDVFRVVLREPDLSDQVNENTANIEFLAIMSDIEL